MIMISIRDRSEAALSYETHNNLVNIVNDKAALIDAEMQRYRGYSEVFAAFLTTIYREPERFSPWDPWDKIPEGFTGRYPTCIRRSEDIDKNKFAHEIAMADNVALLLDPLMKDESKNISAVYWGNENGILTGFETNAAPDIFYDFFAVPWYEKCKKSGESVYTDIYLDGTGRGLTITSASPYYDKDGNFHGVFGVDVLISSLYEESVKLELGEGAYAFLVDNNGNVVSPDGEAKPLMENESIDEATAERLLKADRDVFLYNDVYYTSAKVESTGWIICLHLPQSLVMKPVYSIDSGIRAAIISFVVVFALILIIVLFIIRRFSDSITEPIIALREDVRNISGGKLDYVARVTTNDEIGDLANSFNDMNSSLKEYIEDVKQMTSEKERIKAELSVAYRIQSDLLPSVFPAFPDRKEFDIYASMTAAKEVGGDFYDFFLTDDDHLGVVIADVSGKGVPAAMFMAISKTMIKNYAMTGIRPSEVLKKTNDFLCENNEQNLFVTAWFGIITLSSGEVVSADAGHETPLLLHNGNFTSLNYEHFPPLATMDDNEYYDYSFRMEKGDSLFIYTDGVLDAKNKDNKRFGIERLSKLITLDTQDSPEKLINTVKESVYSFIGEMDPFDDITMMCVKYNGADGPGADVYTQ